MQQQQRRQLPLVESVESVLAALLPRPETGIVAAAAAFYGVINL